MMQNIDALVRSQFSRIGIDDPENFLLPTYGSNRARIAVEIPLLANDFPDYSIPGIVNEIEQMVEKMTGKASILMDGSVEYSDPALILAAEVDYLGGIINNATKVGDPVTRLGDDMDKTHRRLADLVAHYSSQEKVQERLEHLPEALTQYVVAKTMLVIKYANVLSENIDARGPRDIDNSSTIVPGAPALSHPGMKYGRLMGNPGSPNTMIELVSMGPA